MRKKVLALVLMLILLGLPTVIRWRLFYEGGIERQVIPRPDLEAVEVRAPEMEPFRDRYGTLAPGTILVDMAHENRFEMSELNVLQARLSARGQQIELVESGDDLVEKLRYAKALVVISPGESFTADEIQHIEIFVEKGGRLLLVTDPTRFGLRFDEYGLVVGLDSDVVFVNDLAVRFGLVFQPDHLYNTVENEGNFRNIRLTDLAEDVLTEGLEQVVFFATHSIASEELDLITASGETRSSNSERAEELAVAVLADDGAVLALGDLTFMTEPNNAVYDNDRLIANIADFLSGAQREYELVDFPFFFGDEVDLVYAGAPLLDSDFLRESSVLQIYFAGQGKELTVREEEDQNQDTLFLGLYAHTEDVDTFLTAAGVTLWITSTEMLKQEPELDVVPLPEEESAIDATPTLTVTPTITATPALTEPVGFTETVTLTGTLGVTVTAEVTTAIEVSPVFESRVEITSLGQMVVTGTALLTLQTFDERQVLVVLANTEAGLENAVGRLTEGDLEDCLFGETTDAPAVTLALCPTGEVGLGQGSGGWQEPEAEPPPTATPTPTITPTLPITDTVEPVEPIGEPEGSIIVVAFDAGEGRYDSMTSAGDYEDILGARYDVKVWSVAQDGLPDAFDFSDYDLVIWTTGDFEYPIGDEESELLFPVLLEGKPLILSGAYLDETAATAIQRDIQVADATHPVAEGFEPEEVITFVPPPSGRQYEINVLETDLAEESVTVFVRGPDSEAAGESSIGVAKEEVIGMRIAIIGFPIYLLPQEAKTRLVLNTVDWLLADAE